MSSLSQLTMESVLLWVIVLALHGFHHHVATLPTSTVQVSVGEDAILQCPLMNASNASKSTTAAPTARSTLSWYRKPAGQGPQLLLTIRSSDGSHVRYGDGVGPDKVSATANGSLLLRGSQQSDSAVYYCGISQGDEHQKEPTPQILPEK
ncbi:secreted immunoglobulin domain 1 [Acanthochromis polyacanthus]|uniref:secreted immunoglobulin domain 1 n=1 Tax=Acanthochromis polyacanthus TaxID=80966 RepID=UPI002234DC79|nr:secreted immunoglobulin domain 1 [Acanthochromis polyacanthus]